MTNSEIIRLASECMKARIDELEERILTGIHTKEYIEEMRKIIEARSLLFTLE